MAGDQYVHEDKWEEALPFMERAVALDSTFEPALMHEADSLLGLGRLDDLLAVAQRWTERAPSGPGLRALATAYAFRGRVEESVAAARRALDVDGTPYSRTALAEALLLAGRYGEAEALVRAYAAPTASVLNRRASTGPLVAALAFQGRRREALQIVDDFPEALEEKHGEKRSARLELLLGDGPTVVNLREARALAASGSPKAQEMAALPLLALGDLEGAARMAKGLPPLKRRQYEAALAWKKGDRARSLSMLRELVKVPDLDVRGPSLFLLAKVAAEEGRDDEVVQAVEKLRVTPGGTWRTWAWPHALLLAAKAHDRVGERGKARAAVDEVLAMWKDADADLPFLAEARSMRGRLAMR
jgi:tetratricopeptide (TPR) repeat protein